MFFAYESGGQLSSIFMHLSCGKFPNVCFPWEEHFEKLHDGLVPVKFPNVFSSLGKKTFGKKNKIAQLIILLEETPPKTCPNYIKKNFAFVSFGNFLGFRVSSGK